MACPNGSPVDVASVLPLRRRLSASAQTRPQRFCVRLHRSTAGVIRRHVTHDDVIEMAVRVTYCDVRHVRHTVTHDVI